MDLFDLASSQYRDQRSETLDPDLVNQPFADGWVFPVPASFKDALDITWDVRQENLIKRKTWTQGRDYRFAPGDTLYDSKLPYTKHTWAEALKDITICLEVRRATPASVKGFSEGEVEFAVYRPDEDNKKIIATGTLECTQIEFVTLLRTGRLRGKTLEGL